MASWWISLPSNRPKRAGPVKNSFWELWFLRGFAWENWVEEEGLVVWWFGLGLLDKKDRLMRCLFLQMEVLEIKVGVLEDFQLA